MEELKRLAVQYYKNTVRRSFFGAKGFIYILLAASFLALSLYLNFKLDVEKLMILPILVSAAFWHAARSKYDKNLIRHLSYYTHSDNKDVSVHKALYLSELTSHVAPSLFEVMQIFKEIIETNNRNRSFVPDNTCYHFSRFLYDPESKNRILSLLIYLISLIALLTVVKPDSQFNIYELIQSLSMQVSGVYLFSGMLMIIFGYLLFVVPFRFILSFVVIPVLLRFSFSTVLIRFFISELNKYSFLEQRIQQIRHPS